MFEKLSLEDIIAAPIQEVQLPIGFDRLFAKIREKMLTVESNGFKPKYVIMNNNNYEKLVSFSVKHESPLPQELYGLPIIVWDVPLDYVDIYCDAPTEYAYKGLIRSQRP